MSEKVNDRILEKIKKCLALGDSPEPEEAAAGIRQAQKLMEKYGVDSLDLSMSNVGETEFKSKVSISKLNDWELRMVHLVARAFGCRVMWTSGFGRTTGHYTLIGLKSQIKIANYTCEVLQRKLMNARQTFLKNAPTYWDRKTKTTEGDGFCQGWLNGIASKVQAMSQSETTREMINRKVDEKSSGKEAKVKKRQVGLKGYFDGVEAGANESLYRPMESMGQNKRLS